jgi:arsenate reductase
MPEPTPDKVYNILILCTGNSARSIIGEALINKEGKGRFRGFSADSPRPAASRRVLRRRAR